MKFDEVVESIDELTLLEQIKLKELLTKRLENIDVISKPLDLPDLI